MKSNVTKRLSLVTLVLTAMMSLTACKGESSRTLYVSSCPPLAGYTKAEQSEVADKMQQTPNEAWVKMIVDYGVLRKNIRDMC